MASPAFPYNTKVMPTSFQTPQNLAYLHTIVDNISDLIILISVDQGDEYTVLFVNQAFKRSAGYLDIVGKRVRDVVPAEDYPKMAERYAKVKTTKKEIRYTTVAKVPNGEKAYSVKILPIVNALDECVQLIGITREIEDVTEA